jgi:L-ascorbate metabolism protein UlaG (beta-lactamase superfamily)
MATSLTFAGHSTVLIEKEGVRVLTDPVLRRRVGPLRRQVPPPAEYLSTNLDAVLVSHLHHDHLDLPSLRRIDPSTRVIGPAGARELLEGAGMRRVTELRAGERTEVGSLIVEGFPAEHGVRRRPWGKESEAMGFVIGASERVYFAGDTDRFEEMERLAGGLEVALLPVWGWGPTLGAGHLGPGSAAEVAALLRPRLAVPIHWGTLFPIGLARLRGSLLRRPPREFAERVAKLAPEVEVRVLRPGESTSL